MRHDLHHLAIRTTRAAFLAANEGEEAIRGWRIAKETDIPRNYLFKILTDLNNAGIVSASRGTGGDYRLAASPASITLDQGSRRL